MMDKFKYLLKRILSIISTVIVVLMITRLFFFDIYEVPSSSMEPTLIPGDYIIVSKMSYGTRLVNMYKLFREKKLEYTRLKGWGEVKRGDVFVFNRPKLGSPNPYGIYFVKRCYSLPGDTVLIRNKEPAGKGRFKVQKNSKIFPDDSLLNWTISNYGPLFVPRKGFVMSLRNRSARYYKDLFIYEGVKPEIHGDSLFLNNVYATQYRFKYDYYFMKGDNFYKSIDSRFWGVASENHIIGKAVIVLFSYGIDSSGGKKFRWDRLLKSIK